MLKSVLIISGLIGMYVGAEMLFNPVAFYAKSEVDLGNNISLLSDIRSTGGLLTAIGVVIVLGAFRTGLTFTSIVFSTLLYLSYGISRIFSVVVDGVPVLLLVYVNVAELIIGLICAFMLLKLLRKEK